MQIDHPKTRDQYICPVCDGAKDKGLVSCWPCHRAYLKHGDTLAVAQLDAFEASL